MRFNENLDVFFRHLDVKDVRIGPVGAERVIKGYFDNAQFSISDGYAAVSVTQPTITCKTSDVADIEEGTRVVVEFVTYPGERVCRELVEYSVKLHRPGGTGISEVDLLKS